MFLLCTSSRPVLGPTHWVPGALSLGGKRPEHETYQLVPEVNTWICTSTPPYAFVSQSLIKHRENFLHFVFCPLLVSSFSDCKGELLRYAFLARRPEFDRLGFMVDYLVSGRFLSERLYSVM
jgi:hypothetical protein